jgi:acetyl esterase/lipase
LRDIASKTPPFQFNRRTLWLARLMTKILARPVRMPEGIQVQNTLISSEDQKNKIRVRVYQAQQTTKKTPALLWMHGGGTIAGTPEMDDSYVLPFIQEAGVAVVSVDYRLSPGCPYPGALNDCYSALKWLVAQADTLGVDPQRIAVGGNSAGAGLAATLAQLALDRGEIQPVFQLLVYPMLDDRTAARKDLDPQAYYVWDNHSNRFGWESYLNQPCGMDHIPAGSVPARRENLTGLPPAWIGVGSLDVFHDEDVTYARRLKEAGVACELVVIAGGFHGFDVSAPKTQVAKDFRKSQVQTLKKALK